MDEKSPRVQPTRHRSVFIPARPQTALDAQNRDETTEGGNTFPSFPLHPVFGELWVHFDRSWDAVAGFIFVNVPKWIRPGEAQRAGNLSIIGCMSDIFESANSVKGFEDDSL